MTYLKLLITLVLWGGTFIAGRLVVQESGPLAAAFCRFAIASVSLVLLTYGIEGGLPRPPRRLWLPLAILGLTGSVAYVCHCPGGSDPPRKAYSVAAGGGYAGGDRRHPH